ncbi:MAG: peroxidase family protein [Xanthomonadales bacterium]|nr:peroxidase family protein [Xanthomonadales bacterium]
MKNHKQLIFLSLLFLITVFIGSCKKEEDKSEYRRSSAACVSMASEGLLDVTEDRAKRFHGKVQQNTALCRGGDHAVKYRDVPWLDWANYWGAGDASSKGPDKTGAKHLSPTGRGIDGALLDLEYQRIELIKFNLFDNYTFKGYVKGIEGRPGSVIKVWDEMRLPGDHPNYTDVGGDNEQTCSGELIRHRNLTGICNDIINPLMGSTNTLFARNVQFETSFPRLGKNELVRNRHGDRLSLLVPDPQLISRRLFTRQQSAPGACANGYGAEDSDEAVCDYIKAPFFNVMAAFWIQFMNHDWFSHLEEGRNQASYMEVGCDSSKAEAMGCRPNDRIDKALVAQEDSPERFTHDGTSYLERAPKTFRNTNTAWWDASQIYGYDERSRIRVKRDPDDAAKLQMLPRGQLNGRGDSQGYLPILAESDPMNPVWAGQAATGFPDNWTIGMSFYHNVFAREHNAFVDGFRQAAGNRPDADSGLRNPEHPGEVITNANVSDDELFEVARLVVAAEIAKIHTIEWTTQLLYNEPLYRGMNANWSGLLGAGDDHKAVRVALDKVIARYNESDSDDAGKWYSVFASGPGILGLGSKTEGWSLSNPKHVNGGVNHFGSPFNFPEEFMTVYRLHPLLPDALEFRNLDGDPNKIVSRTPIVKSFRGAASDMMTSAGLGNTALSLGRQRLGLLTLGNHPGFLQNLEMQRLETETKTIDVAALDLVRDRERGIPRFNEFRRQYGLTQLTRFDDFVDTRLAPDSAERQRQEAYVIGLREVYGQHVCDASKVITDSQLNADGSQINDCLGHPDGSTVDNVEDVDTVVGWLAEGPRPHGFAISETQFVVFIINASRRLYSDRFFTSSYRPEFYTQYGLNWVNDNGPDGKVMEKGEPNGHQQEVSTMKRVLLRTVPELRTELDSVVNVFDPWARDRGEYYSLAWKARPGAEDDESFQDD